MIEYLIVSRVILQSFQDSLYKNSLQHIQDLVAMERRFPFTMGSEEFSQLRTKALSEFKAQLESARSHAYNGKFETVNKALASLAEAGYTGLTARDLSRLKESPVEDEALTVMAALDAYFCLAIKRFGDTVPMSIDFYYLSRTSVSLEKELLGRLGILDKAPEVLLGMLQEERDVMERRAALMAQKARLESVWEMLHRP